MVHVITLEVKNHENKYSSHRLEVLIINPYQNNGLSPMPFSTTCRKSCMASSCVLAGVSGSVLSQAGNRCGGSFGIVGSDYKLLGKSWKTKQSYSSYLFVHQWWWWWWWWWRWWWVVQMSFSRSARYRKRRNWGHCPSGSLNHSVDFNHLEPSQKWWQTDYIFQVCFFFTCSTLSTLL